MILIPENEDRVFKYGILPNKLKYTIISDEKSDKSSVVMSVRTGSLYEPLEYMGLAHFLEHMLFMGSKKYQKEDYFFAKLKELGGSSNAYTDNYQTVYYFDILSNNLEKIIDIFSRFFIDPLFNINSVSREINAVNSEHMKNYNNDFWIIRQFILNIAEKDNIINRFSTGSHKTLGSDINKVRNAMIDFYNKYYCANNMCLTVQSNKPIKEIEQLIKNYFCDVKERKKNIIHPLVPIKKYKQYNKEYQLQTVRNIDSIVYFWELPDFNYFKDNRIIDVINNAINLNCKKNLINTLIETQLVSNIETFYLDIGIFVLSIDIMPTNNIINSITIINDMVRYYFNNLLNNSKNNSWDDIYDYNIKSFELLYNNSVKENNMDLATNISNNMHYYDENNIYKGNKLVIKKELDKLYDILKLLVFDKANIVYSTNKKLCNSVKKDKYYDKYYCSLNKSFIPETQKEYDYNILIDKNVFKIKPKNIKHLDKYNKPRKVAERFWYGGVSKFNEPIVIGQVIINNNKYFNSIKNILVTLISINIINYYLQLEFCNEIDIGYKTDLTMSNSLGIIIINMVGFNDKYIDFFNKVLDKMKSINPSANIIKNYIDSCNESIENIKKWSPWELNSHLLSIMINKYSYYYKDELIEIKNITPNMIIKRINNIINLNQPVTTVIYGNIKISSNELNKFQTYKKNLNMVINEKPSLKLPYNITIKHPNKDELNSCISFIFPLKYTHENHILSAKLLLLNTIMERPAFDELRTKHQLGYLVACKLRLDKVSYIKLSVQSTENIKRVEHLMNEFINKTMENILNNITGDEFKTLKQSVFDNLLEKDTNLFEMSSHYINEILIQEYVFDRPEQIANKIKHISLNDIKELYHSIIKKKTVIKILN